MSLATAYSGGTFFGNFSGDFVGCSTVRANELQCEQISLSPGSLQTAIEVNDPLRCSLSRIGTATITAATDNAVVPFTGLTSLGVISLMVSGAAVDATATSFAVAAGADSFTIKANAAATADVIIKYCVLSL